MDVEIPEDFHIIEAEGKYLAHKSCVYNKRNAKFSNTLFTLCEGDMLETIKLLRIICDINNKLSEKTLFIDGRYKVLYIFVVHERCIALINELADTSVEFVNVQKLLYHLAKNYPKCIK